MAMTAREAAWSALQRWRKNGAWSDAALNIVLQNAQLAPRDAALAARICYGTLQNLALLDHYLAAYCTTPLQKLEPKVLDLLRLSAYQIVLLDKVPPRAAVNEAVALCRKGGCARAAGLVNAVLRRVAEHRDALPEIPGAGTASYLAVRTSHPQWLAQMLIDAHGYDFAERALAANNADAPACLQVNTLKTTTDALATALRADGIETQPHPWLPDALLCRGGNLAAARAFADGWFYVQDAAAHCAVLAAGVRPGMRVLDACAAPGGKSFAAAVQMRDQGCMISCDIHENKWKRIRAGAERLGLSCISTRTMDARRPDADLVGTMDVVLADVPCSGLGVIRKKPEIRFKTRRRSRSCRPSSAIFSRALHRACVPAVCWCILRARCLRARMRMWCGIFCARIRTLHRRRFRCRSRRRIRRAECLPSGRRNMKRTDFLSVS